MSNEDNKQLLNRMPLQSPYALCCPHGLCRQRQQRGNLVSFWKIESEHDVAWPSYFAGN